MTPFYRHVRAAEGFLELGMPLDAHKEYEEIEPEMRAMSEVFAVRVELYRALGKWEAMAVVASRLCELQDDWPQWPLSLAYATRRWESLEAGLLI